MTHIYTYMSHKSVYESWSLMWVTNYKGFRKRQMFLTLVRDLYIYTYVPWLIPCIWVTNHYVSHAISWSEKMTFARASYLYESRTITWVRGLHIGWQNLEILAKKFQSVPGEPEFSFIISAILLLIVNPTGRIMVRWKRFRNNLKIFGHPISMYTHMP